LLAARLLRIEAKKAKKRATKTPPAKSARKKKKAR
jgi:hypothetical protein